jgi:hypothetical protein
MAKIEGAFWVGQAKYGNLFMHLDAALNLDEWEFFGVITNYLDSQIQQIPYPSALSSS